MTIHENDHTLGEALKVLRMTQAHKAVIMFSGQESQYDFQCIENVALYNIDGVFINPELLLQRPNQFEYWNSVSDVLTKCTSEILNLNFPEWRKGYGSFGTVTFTHFDVGNPICAEVKLKQRRIYVEEKSERFVSHVGHMTGSQLEKQLGRKV